MLCLFSPLFPPSYEKSQISLNSQKQRETKPLSESENTTNKLSQGTFNLEKQHCL
jgi:hypothetical protein